MRIAGLALGLALLVAGGAQAACDADTALVRGPDGSVARFSVEVAADPASRARGLMFRDRLAPSAGMIFVYERPQRAVFWMKNTEIPLDMIFADATGRVTTVHANAVPHDETGIDGGDGVVAVLEINGGLAARLGIVPGSAIQHPLLDPSLAVLPCE